MDKSLARLILNEGAQKIQQWQEVEGTAVAVASLLITQQGRVGVSYWLSLVPGPL